MVQVLASRVAGYRLATLVMLLLLPVLYFGAVITSDSLNSYRLALANKAAVQLVDMTFRTMEDLTSGWSVSDQQKVLLDGGESLAQTAGVLPEFRSLRSSLTTENPDRSTSLDFANRLVVAIGNGPLMNAAGNPEANSLAEAGGVLLPNLLITKSQMQVLADGTMLDPAKASQGMSDIALLSAELTLRGKRLRKYIEMARANSASPNDYESLYRNTAQLVSGTEQFRGVLFEEQRDSLSKMQMTSAALRKTNAAWHSQILDIWGELHDRLIAISDARLSELKFWAARTFGCSIAAVVIGLGLAIRMFRSTLIHLDQLEISRKEAEGARYLAESSSEELAQLNASLADMNKEVSHHLKSLEDAQEQLVKKGRMEQMGQLTATMAHELRNPLGAARTSIFLLERKTRGKGLGVESQIQRITNAIMRCDDIITQLLDFSRTKKLSPTSADFDTWLEKVVTEEAARLPNALSISIELGTQGKPIAFDPSRMHRAITNLLNNASEAMVGTGDDASKFSVPDPSIAIRSTIVGNMMQLTITDNGPGISAENLARVREPLFTTKSFGTGLGLPAVEQIAAQHGGSMQITSEVGIGTTATITLPLETVLEAA